MLPLPEILRPEDQPWSYPNHNENFGVEQDFFRYLLNNSDLVTKNPQEADWHYLGVYWTRWHLANQQKPHVETSILNDKKTFTICQHDDGPMVNLGDTIQFLASRKTASGFDIPLLSSDHRFPWWNPRKKYLASFMGRLDTHQIRQTMADKLCNRNDVYIFGKHKSPRSFVRKILQSYIALAPRGYGGSSFRFFEAMQLGVVPFLIGDIDTRPFKKYIEYDMFSLYTDDPKAGTEILDSKTREQLLAMGSEAKKIYEEKLAYQKWCKLVIKTLHDQR